MKERPILFSGPMVRALLDGSKTQTRRVMNPQPTYSGYTETQAKAQFNLMVAIGALRSPYGQEGGKDRLWVRETWRVCGGREYEYQQDRSQAMYRATHQEDGFPLTWESYTWRPSIFMPRWASRITLEVTGVRVERLQDISIGDAIAEGCPGSDHGDRYAAIEQYLAIWESINGPGSWDLNPWVWVIEFKRVTP